MRRIINSTYLSLDGAMEEPHHWSIQYFDDDAGKLASEQLFASDALLMGRRTYEHFAKSWPGRDGVFADRFNGMKKYVATKTLVSPAWNNARVLGGDLVSSVAELKGAPGEDILMYGYGPVARTLSRAGLLDEIRFWIHPIFWGKGEPGSFLFRADETQKLELVGTRVLRSGVVVLSYRPAAHESGG